MSFLTPLYVLGLAALVGSDRVPPDPPVAPRRSAVQLADVSVADPAAADPAEPAGPSSALAPAGACARLAGVCVCPARFCVRRLVWVSAMSSAGGSLS